MIVCTTPAFPAGGISLLSNGRHRPHPPFLTALPALPEWDERAPQRFPAQKACLPFLMGRKFETP
jgi:hypothetical protein